MTKKKCNSAIKRKCALTYEEKVAIAMDDYARLKRRIIRECGVKFWRRLNELN